MTLPTLSNKIPSSYTTSTVVRKIKDGSLHLVGVSITDQALKYMTEADVKELASSGVNHVRLHHLEWAIWTGRMTVTEVTAFITLLRKYGIVVSVGLCDKLGEVTPWGLHEFKRELVDKQTLEAEKYYAKNIEIMIPILQHPACFMVCLTNEAAHLTDWEKGIVFWNKWSPRVRAINPKLMLTDMPDCWQQESEWVHAIKLYDAFAVHFYGGAEDFSGVHPSWIDEEWHINGLKWLIGWLEDNGTPKPVMIQEFGSWSVNPHYLENELYLWLESAINGWNPCQFAWDTGSPTDKYATRYDPDRARGLVVGALINKNAAGLTMTRELDGQRVFEVTGTTVAMTDRHDIKVGSYVFRTDPCPEWARLTKAL